MMRWQVIIAVAWGFATSIAAADDMRRINVEGWENKRPVDVYTYTSTGAPLGRQDLSAVKIAGFHAWNFDYDIVEVAPGRWVQRKELRLILCGTVKPGAKPDSARSVIAVGTSQQPAKTGYGSGAQCQD